MQSISQYLKYLTDYRDNLMISAQEYLTHEAMWLPANYLPTNPNDKKAPYINKKLGIINRFLSEIMLCNTYIEYLSGWDKHYNGEAPFPFGKEGVIKYIEELIIKDKDRSSYFISVYNTKKS